MFKLTSTLAENNNKRWSFVLNLEKYMRKREAFQTRAFQDMGLYRYMKERERKRGFRKLLDD